MSIHYTIKPIQPDAHLFEVTLTVDRPDPDGQVFTLPNWIPGSYMIRDFSRNIVRIEAATQQGPIALDKLGKSAWQVPAGAGPIELRYEVYAWELSVRAAHLDRLHGFFNGTSVFLQVDGQELDPVTVSMEAPDHASCQGWQVATAMTPEDVDANGFGLYRADDYDELIDHPVEMGTFERIEFDACGVRHEVILTGSGVFDRERLASDLKRLCECQIRFFATPAPVERYVFLVMVVGSGYGGLEHRASTALLITREHLPRPGLDDIDDRYLEFLGLCSHEYFHTWNVKRIKPARFVPYDLQKESPTRLLWFFEGVTSYYDDLFLARCGLIDSNRYLTLLAKTLTRVQRGAGRHRQSVTDSSFDAWHKFYKQDENAPNAIVSYYAKGALVVLCLDAEIRRISGGEKTLDDLMRQLWQRWLDSGAGLLEQEPEAAASELVDRDLGAFFKTALYSTDELPLVDALASLGVSLTWRVRSSANDTGSVESSSADSPDETEDSERQPWLGASLSSDNAQLTLRQVYSGGPAEQAGLASGDTLIAMDQLAVTRESVDSLLKRHCLSDDIPVHYMRLGRLHQTLLPIELPNEDTASLTLADARRIDTWLNGY